MNITLTYEKPTDTIVQFRYKGIVVIELTKVTRKDKRMQQGQSKKQPISDGVDYLVYINDTFLTDLNNLETKPNSKTLTFATEYLTKIRKVTVEEVEGLITGAALEGEYLCLQIKRRNDKGEIYYEQLKPKLLPIWKQVEQPKK